MCRACKLDREVDGDLRPSLPLAEQSPARSFPFAHKTVQTPQHPNPLPPIPSFLPPSFLPPSFLPSFFLSSLFCETFDSVDCSTKQQHSNYILQVHPNFALCLLREVRAAYRLNERGDMDPFYIKLLCGTLPH